MLHPEIALQFYGAAAFQHETGDLVGVSQSAVCRTVNEVSEKTDDMLYPLLLLFPEDSQAREGMCDSFQNVRIRSHVFRSRKGVFSINVLGSPFFFPILSSAPEKKKVIVSFSISIF